MEFDAFGLYQSELFSSSPVGFMETDPLGDLLEKAPNEYKLFREVLPFDPLDNRQ